MNVREDILRTKIDPFLTPERLSLAARMAGYDAESAAEIKILSGGCWNRVVAVSFSTGEPDLVFKISPDERDEKIIREYKVLGYFAGRTSLPVPRPVFLDTSARLIPGTLLVMSRLPGVVLHRVYGLLDRQMLDRLSDQIAAQVIELHAEHESGFGRVEAEDGGRFAGWAEFWLPRFDAVFTEIEAANLLPGAFLEQVEKVRRVFHLALDIGQRSTLTHYDIWSGNVMVDFEGGVYPGAVRVSGYIDVPGYWADFARELSFMEMFGIATRRFYDRYWSAYPPDQGFELRKNIYNLKMHLKHICMYPGENYYRQGAESCLRCIQRII